MSVYTEVELRCDGADGPYDCEPAVYASTGGRARQDAREMGWLVSQPGGKDYCARPEHRPSSTTGSQPLACGDELHGADGGTCPTCGITPYQAHGVGEPAGGALVPLEVDINLFGNPAGSARRSTSPKPGGGA